MYAIVILSMLVSIFFAFGPSPQAERAQVVQAKARVVAEQALVQHEAAVNSVKLATMHTFTPGVVPPNFITEPSWFMAGGQFISAVDGANLVVTYYAKSPELNDAVVARLGQITVATSANSVTGQSIIAGSLGRDASGNPFVAAQTHTAIPTQVSIAPVTVAGVASGTPVLISVIP